MNILNFEALNKAGLNKFPWEWGVLEDLISRDFACKLEKESKNLCFKRVHAQRSDKSYNMGMYEVDGSLDQNSAIAQLANEIKTEKYILALENFSNLSLINKRISINVWQYTHEDYLSPHVDKPEKYLTQLIYFNSAWPSSFGGQLNILSAEDENSVVQRILPLYKNSAVIRTTSSSWHSVSAVTELGISRYCMQIIFWVDE